MTIWMEASSPDLTRRPNLVGDHNSGAAGHRNNKHRHPNPERPRASVGMMSLGEHPLVVLETVASGNVPLVAHTCRDINSAPWTRT